MNNELPKVYQNIFDIDYFEEIKKYFNEYQFPENQELDVYGSHRIMSFDGDEVLTEAHNKVIDFARSVFKNESIVPSYATYIKYFGDKSQLKDHLDEGPSTYLIDVCLSYKTQWPIVVNNIEFNLEPNEALAFYATKQLHHRPPFTDANNNVVEMLMFAFVDPDSIWWKINDHHRVEMVKRFLYQKNQN